MHKKTLAGGLIALSILLAGCPESVNPVSDPNDAVHDPALFGTWYGKFDDEDDQIYLHIGAGDNGMTSAVLVETKEGGGIKIERYIAFPSFLPNAKVLNVRSREDAERGYTILRYKVKDDDELILWITSYAAVREDIMAGKLKGVAKKGEFGETRITASTAEIQAYLVSSDRGRLFDRPLEFERLEP